MSHFQRRGQTWPYFLRQPAVRVAAGQSAQPHLQWRTVTDSKRAPAMTMIPFSTRSKTSDARHMQRIWHKHGRRSYLTVGVSGDSQSLLELEPIRSKDRSILSYNIDVYFHLALPSINSPWAGRSCRSSLSGDLASVRRCAVWFDLSSNVNLISNCFCGFTIILRTRFLAWQKYALYFNAWCAHVYGDARLCLSVHVRVWHVCVCVAWLCILQYKCLDLAKLAMSAYCSRLEDIDYSRDMSASHHDRLWWYMTGINFLWLNLNFVTLCFVWP